MTQIVIDDGEGPRLHAFVVGVGAYPYCDNPPKGGAASRLLGDLGSVTSPPPSATAVAEWLLTAPRGGDDPPIGTVEVLISGATPTLVRRGDGGRVPVAKAVFDEFKGAFRRWFEQCNANPGNIALFYFCGHGWHLDGQLLLLEDLGKDPEAVLENSAELSEIRTVMQYCKARTQLYFVDACRQMPPDFFQISTRTRPLMDRPQQITFPLQPLDAPVYFSTAQRFEVEVDRGTVTPFTTAVLRTLDGLGAYRTVADRWTIETHRFGLHLRDVIAWDNPDIDRWECLTVEGEQSGATVLRTLDGPPRVPFKLTCVPGHALPLAVISIQHLQSNMDPAIEVAPDGQGEVTAGAYHLQLTFPDGADFQKASLFAEVLPPNKTWYAAVESA